MRAAYLILCDPWANGHPIAEQLAQRLIEEGWQDDGGFGTMRLFRKGDMPVEPLPPAAGFVLGMCHAMHVPCSALEGGADAVMRFCDHFAGGTIATAAWGNFIAARSDPNSGLAEIYRAPFSSIPAFFAHQDNLFVVSSHVATLRALTGRAGIDMDRVAELLIADGLPSARTAIQGISELLSGQALLLERNGARVLDRWNAASFAVADEAIEDVEDATERLRRHLTRAVRASVSGASRPMLDFSGGLDSSIIASVLAAAGVDLQLLNFRYGTGAGDEAQEAQQTAHALGLDCHVVDLDPASVDVDRSASSQLPYVVGFAYMQGQDQAARSAADAFGSDCGLNGAGGDNIFCHLQSSGPLADALLRFGPGSRALATARDVATAAPANLFHVLHRGIGKAFKGASRRFPANHLFLSDPLRTVAVDEAAHPWLNSEHRLRPGKYEHVAAILQADFYARGYDRPDQGGLAFPLLSQPLVETCLRIPSWMWICGGINRSLARQAMAKALPHPVTLRTSKGGHEAFGRDMFRTNFPRLRDIVMDGRLARHSLVDRDRLALALQNPSAVSSRHQLRLMRLVDWEAWMASTA